ncbi:MAG: hypothetical protein WC939_05950, partial [Acholeplasmataceae bacterium]
SSVQLTVSAAMAEAIATTLDEDDEFLIEFASMQGDINQHEIDIEDLKQKDTDILDGTQAFTEISLDDGLGNIETITHASKKALDNEVARLENDKSDITYVDSQDNALGVRIDDVETNIDETEADILALETANMIKSITRSGSNLFTITYYDDTTSSLLTLAELKTFIGEATQSLSGLMSAQDKTDIDTLMALFDSDGDSVVNTIAEILAIFENYPEGVDLVTALAGKVDKVAGKSLVDDDEITKLEGLDDQTTLDGKFALKVDKTQTIAGVDLQDNITQEELKIALDIDDAETNITNLQAKDIEHEKDLIDHEQRIDSIEAITRKQNSDIASVDDDGIGILHMGKDVAETTVTTKIEGMLLDSEQLVTNGDFSDGLNNWTIVTSNEWSLDNGMLKFTPTGNTRYIRQPLTINAKAYLSFDIISPTISSIWPIGFDIQYRNYVTGTHSKIADVNITNFDFYANTSSQEFWVDNINSFNISNLIDNKQYSPLYSTTFDLMSDAQIKAQMDLWVANKTLPNSVMSVDMDKRVTSQGKQLFDKSKYATNYAYKISVKPSTQYTWSISALYKTYDKDMNEVSSGTNTTLTVGDNVYYIAFSGIADIDTFQLEQNSVATTYENYRSSSMYLDSGEVGYSYQGTTDSIEFRNGEALFINRVNDTQDGLRTTPIETPISVVNNAMAYPNGTFLIEDVVRRSGVYNGGITVDKPIKALDNIYKLNDDGSSTKLAVSGATVAVDGLSFTHTSLSNGDFVWFDYYYQGTNVKGLSTVYYYGDKMIVAGSGTTSGKVYKIVPTVVDENIVWTKVEV